MVLKIKSKTVRWIVGTIVLVCVIGGIFLVDFGGEAVEELQPVRPLKMFTVGKVSQPAVRDYPGKVAAKNKAILAFQVSRFSQSWTTVIFAIVAMPPRRPMTRPRFIYSVSGRPLRPVLFLGQT